MMKISDLQRQIALNRSILQDLEESVCMHKIAIRNILSFNRIIKLDSDTQERLNDKRISVSLLKKKIKQYAKLQRALKSELAYRIQYNRAVREIESARDENEDVEWVIVSDEVFDKMLKGE